jgi:uncharacterized membrane protein
MAKEHQPSNPSLLLHEALEAEFIELHGALPENYPTTADEAARLKAIWSAIHALKEKRAALCISGGGIRSATFGLGVLQGLARCGLLEKFHYLSTVSGGGFIGGWLSAWINRDPNGLTSVSSQLARPRDAERPNPEPIEIQNLRSYSNYLSPRLGILSADTWTLLATYIRNLLLTSLVVIPLLAAALAIPWFFESILMKNPIPYTLIPLWIGVIGVAIGVAYMGINLPCGGDKRGSQINFLIWCLVPLLVAAFSMTTFWAWWVAHARPTPEWSFFGLTPPHEAVAFIYLGILMHLLSWVSSLLRAHGFRFKEFIAVVVSGGIGGWLLWLAATKIFPQPLAVAELYGVFAVPLFLALFFLAVVTFAGISSRWTHDEDREWWGRAAGWLLVVMVGWIVVSGLVIFGSYFLNRALAMLGGAAGIFTILAGRSTWIPATAKERDKASSFALVMSKASAIAAIIFVALLVVLLTRAMTWSMMQIGTQLKFSWNLKAVSGVVGQVVEYLNVILYTPTLALALFVLGLVIFGVAMALLINTNKFSLHAVYRDRLIRAYLGASNKTRKPNPFTGFDEGDNIRMRELWLKEKFGQRLLPVINVALNLVGGSKLAWQERKAESFTISPLHCGSYYVGYRKTDGPPGERYGGVDGVSLGSAITISGAAASPNMGYHSSPLVTFILTVMNVRLGAWLGNPGPAGDTTYQLGYPNFSVRPMFAEAFGLTNDVNPYVYLSDGGHFENLGLYEMVLRRCHYIVVSDAGEDPECSFADLGDAVRKVRIDLGISIEFDKIDIFCRGIETPQAGRNCAIGRIRYSTVDGADAPDGVLIYIKPACYGNEPRDIYEYFKTHKAFPHETTSDQFFSESQFESYRMLGAYTMERLCSVCAGDFADFIQKILRDHLGMASVARPDNPRPMPP